MKKFYEKKYIIERMAEKERVKCGVCDGKGRILVETVDNFSNKPVKASYSCLKCNGFGTVIDENSSFYRPSLFLVCGKAVIKKDDGSDLDYLVGFKGTEEQLEENLNLYGFKDFSLAPNFLEWYMVGKNQKVFDTEEEAREEILNIIEEEKNA